jgi:hypothetical protein
MELSDPPEAPSDPFGSFSLTDPTIILGDTDIEASSHTLPQSNTINPTTIHNTVPLTSDFLEIPLSQTDFSVAPHCSTGPIRKRGLGLGLLSDLNQTNKTLWFTQEANKIPRDLILNTRVLRH